MNTPRIAAALVTLALLVACNGGGSNNTLPASSGRTPYHAAAHRTIALPHASPTSHSKAPMDANGILQDGGFESGGYTYWQQCGSVNARVATYRAHTGKYSDLNGQVSTPEINGDSGLCQQVTVPANGKLTFWLYEGTNETSTTYAYQEADLLDANGAVIDNLFTEAKSTSGWTQRTYDVSAYAGQSVWIYFGVHADGYSSGDIYQYVDDVAWSSATGTPTPKPTATPSSTPQPTATPQSTATPSPSGGPTPFPTPAGSGPQGTSCGTSCGVQRWHIKTLDDPDEHLIDWNTQSTTVSALDAIPVPSGYNQYDDTSRYAPTETQVYTVRAILVGWKIEADHDYHMVIADPSNPNQTMIVEPPDPTCSDACDSGFGSIFSNVRAQMTNCFGQPPSSFYNFPNTIVADFTGVPLFDALHGQTGVAPNGIELHPLLSIHFISGAPGC
ncbi:MAG: hypothetical protein KGN02_14520 [bacterium]|nr:hypothetical protein [bacterium]